MLKRLLLEGGASGSPQAPRRRSWNPAGRFYAIGRYGSAAEEAEAGRFMNPKSSRVIVAFSAESAPRVA